MSLADKINANKIKILLDAGHYGKYNRSTVIPEYYESEMNWKLHLLFKDCLEKLGFTVGVTREVQTKDLAVSSRGKLAKGYNLFISVHSNACGTESVDRAVVFHSFDNKNNSKVLGEALAKTVGSIMGVSGQLTTNESVKSPGYEYYGVLNGARKVNCPLYYIVEHSFHTNKKATQWLLQDSNLKLLALGEAATIGEYYGLGSYDEILSFLKGEKAANKNIYTPSDYAKAKRICQGSIKPTEEDIKRLDINGDGKITPVDYAYIKRSYMGTL